MLYTVNQIRELIAPIARKYQLPEVYLFGSYARGEADEKSDVDLAVETEGSLAKGLKFIGLEIEFEDALGLPVDLLSIEQINNPRTHIGKLVKDNFKKDKVKIYENRLIGG